MHDSTVVPPDSSSADNQIYLCFDFGLRKIGTAVGQSLTATATALNVIHNLGKKTNWDAIDQLVDEWKPNTLVIGLPLTEAGEEQKTTRQARSFGQQLGKRYSLSIIYADERYTSRQAQSRFREQRRSGNLRRKDAQREDAIAAQIILENWLAHIQTQND